MGKLLSFGTLAVALAALGVAVFGGSPPPPPPVAIDPSGKTEGQLRALERRVALLEETNSLLERKVFELSSLPRVGADGGLEIPAQVASARPAGSPGPAMNELPMGAPTDPAARANLKEAVRAAQDELAAEQRAQRLDRFEKDQARQAAEQSERWKKFTLEANLNAGQEQELKKALDAEAAKRKALMEEVRGGTKTFFDIRGDLRETRTETDRAMSKVLTTDQMKQYVDVRRDERRDNRGGRGGDGPPGDGAPGRGGFQGPP